MKIVIAISILLALSSCYKGETADLVIHNARIQTLDANMSTHEAMAIKDGKILELGPERQIMNKYKADSYYNAGLKWVFPGLVDGHCHFLGYGLNKQKVDLTGCKNVDEMLDRVQRFAEANPQKAWIMGRGWDQNDWPVQEYPDNERLNALFPDRPVILQRIDGHAALVNSAAVAASGMDLNAQVEGGQVLMKEGKFTGILVDNAADIFRTIFNEADEATKREALLRAQKDCFAAGLTGVHDAGLDFGTIELIEKMHAEGVLKMPIYAMVSDEEESRRSAAERGKIVTDRLRVHALKVYSDGALGSRGASLKHHYHDAHDHSGLQLYDAEHMEKASAWCIENDFQMATHAIGDSANALMLSVYGQALSGTNDRRWRIEHAQVVDPKDMSLFATYNVIPSVQPTHATSDMYWAEERLGQERINWAYSYQDLLETTGMLCLGTDFPVEGISPLATFHAAVERTDTKGWPEGGFRPTQKISALEALRGMTINCAMAGFMEEETGTLEAGKYANITVLDGDLLALKKPAYDLTVLATFVHGEKVYTP